MFNIKQKRADRDHGFFKLSPQEYSKFVQNSLNESEQNVVEWYESIKDKLDELIETSFAELEKEGKIALLELESLSRKFGDFIRGSGGKITAVCNGASKVVFILDNGTALKIGYSDVEGLAGEIETTKKYMGIKCFPNMLAYSRKKNSSLVECVITEEDGQLDLVPFYGLNMPNVVYRIGGDEFMCFENASEKVPDNDPSVVRFYKSLKTDKGPAWDSLRDLKMYFENEIPLGDISHHNWGLAIRDGEKVPVVFDYDF